MKTRNMHRVSFFITAVAALMLAGCSKDFLEENPKGKIIVEKTSDYDLLLNGITGITNYPPIVMGDEVAGVDPYFSQVLFGSGQDLRAFRYENDIWRADDWNTDWNGLMTMVYTCNKIINEVMGSLEGMEAQKQSIRAEALTNRAFSYFQLVNLYGKPYDEATAASDLAVPKNTLANVMQEKYTRATVKEIYEFIINDIMQALPQLPAKLSNRSRICKPAAEALLGKVYVFMGQFDKALPLFNAAIADMDGGSIPVKLYDFNKEVLQGGAFNPQDDPLPLFPGPKRPDPNLDNEIVFLKTTNNYYALYSFGMVINPEAAALFTPEDLRLTKFTYTTPTGTAILPPYPLNMRRVSGYGYLANIGISLSDIYLLRAECKSRLNNLTDAVTDMNAFRKLRMPAEYAAVPAAIAGNQVALTKFILEERIREFAIRGYRWFDMRRLSVDPLYKNTIKTIHTLYDATGTVKSTYTLKPERFTIRLPLAVINGNPGMPQNP